MDYLEDLATESKIIKYYGGSKKRIERVAIASVIKNDIKYPLKRLQQRKLLISETKEIMSEIFRICTLFSIMNQIRVMIRVCLPISILL